MQEISIQLQGLKDLTQQEADTDKPLPYAWVNAFETVLGAEVSHSAPDQTVADGRLQALVPKTTVVIKVKPALWEAIKALAESVMTYKLAMKGELFEAGVTAAAVADALKSLKDTVDRLDPDKGELCCYRVVSQEKTFDSSLGKVSVSDKLFAQAHRKYGKGCAAASCMYHDGRHCNVPDSKRRAIVDDLVGRGILQRDGDKLWPIF